MGKQRRFLSAHAAADLYDDILIVVFIFGQKEQTDLLFQLFQTVFALFKLRLGQLPHFSLFAVHQLLGILHILLGAAPGPIGLHHRGQLLLLFQQTGRLFRIGIQISLGQRFFQLAKSFFHKFQLFKHTFLFPLSL